MMMDRDRLGFWVKFVAIGLAVIFLGSSIFMGIGTNIQYNLFDLFGGGDQQQGGQTGPSPEDQIEQAEKNLQENPKDSGAIKSLAFLYIQENRLEDAVRVLEKGRRVAPGDAEIPVQLGQVYYQRAAAAPEKEREEFYGKAGDQFAAAVELEPKDEQIYDFAGQSYDQAGRPDQAIKYWNGYLDLEPKGKRSDQIKDRISELLKGESTTGGAQP